MADAVARRSYGKLVAFGRRQRNGEVAAADLLVLAERLEAAAADADGAIPDQRLALMFACAHPSIARAIRSPLMLQVVLGLDAAMIASAFLISPATMGKRLVRAKDKIRQAGVPFRRRVVVAHRRAGRSVRGVRGRSGTGARSGRPPIPAMPSGQDKTRRRPALAADSLDRRAAAR
jgi:predicted RNA polymerase sigma factor